MRLHPDDAARRQILAATASGRHRPAPVGRFLAELRKASGHLRHVRSGGDR